MVIRHMVFYCIGKWYGFVIEKSRSSVQHIFSVQHLGRDFCIRENLCNIHLVESVQIRIICFESDLISFGFVISG